LGHRVAHGLVVQVVGVGRGVETGGCHLVPFTTDKRSRGVKRTNIVRMVKTDL
jgi:hypothetical protein